MKEFKRCSAPVINGTPDTTEVDELTSQGYKIEKTMYDPAEQVVRIFMTKEVE